MDLKRVKKEAAELANDADSAGVSAKSLGDTMTHWKGTIHGPKDTPYEGGTFVIDIELTSSYPFEPPKMKFDTKVWHPNVSSQTGAICLDILKKEWSPALTIKTALISVQALLAAPEPDDPQDAQVANEYKSDFEKWKRTAKLWTEQYAMGTADTQILAPLLEMGFTEDQVQLLLLTCRSVVLLLPQLDPLGDVGVGVACHLLPTAQFSMLPIFSCVLNPCAFFCFHVDVRIRCATLFPLCLCTDGTVASSPLTPPTLCRLGKRFAMLVATCKQP
jgi:ubiquitin-conjugating enzyme (huntingtin interacting protein 2)